MIPPELQTALDYIKNNCQVDHFDIRKIMIDRPDIDLPCLAVALVLLERDGVLQEKFMIESLENRIFDSLEEIPTDLQDKEVIPIYVPPRR